MDKQKGSESKKVYVFQYPQMIPVGEYPSIRVASEKTGVSRLHINGICNNRYGCKSSNGLTFRFVPPTEEQIEEKNSLPQILLLDIETSLLDVHIFAAGKQHIDHSNIISDRFIHCVCAKWLYEQDVIIFKQNPKEAKEKNDKRIITKTHALMNQADIIITHNGTVFDIPILNTRIAYHRLPPLHPFQTVDTCKIDRKQFGNISNALDYVNRTNNLREKKETNRSLWENCFIGDKSALDMMAEYCANDVLALEEHYMFFRPYMKGHPNLGLYIDTDKTVCPNCGSKNIRKQRGKYFTPAGAYPYFTCECGCHGRYRQNVLTSKDSKGKKIHEKKHKSLGVSMAR